MGCPDSALLFAPGCCPVVVLSTPSPLASLWFSPTGSSCRDWREGMEWGQGIIVWFPLGRSSWAGHDLDKTSFSSKGTCLMPLFLASNSLLSPCPFRLLVDLGHCVSRVGPLWSAHTCVLGLFAHKLSSNYPNLCYLISVRTLTDRWILAQPQSDFIFHSQKSSRWVHLLF